MRTIRIFAVIVSVLLLSATAYTQDQRASVSGTITDPSGGVIPGAQVKVTSLERGTTTETMTNDAGVYVVQFLIPGNYTLMVEMQGFKKFERSNIELRAADKLGMDVRMEVGALSETVQVSTTVSALQTETATRAFSVDNKTIDSIPTSGRNLYQLQYSMPGVIKNSRYHGSMELYAFSNINGVMISGGRSGENETIIDGITNTKGDRGVVIAPALNATQEMTLQSNTYDAQFGRLGGGVTMITLKSGTNQLHGQLFEFHKNYKLGGNDWATNKAGEKPSRFLNNTFGYTVDGPIYIPKLFDGRNRAFFMTSLEGLRERENAGEMTTVPTAEMRTGDFSKLLNGASKPVIIYDPLTTTRNAAGAYVRTPFAGNKLPTNRVSPIAAKVASYVPMPKSAGDGPNFRDNYFNQFPSKNGYNAWMHKVDLRFSDKHNLAFRYGRNYWSNWANVVWGTNEAEPSGEWPSQRNSSNIGFNWTWTVTPSLVFDFRGGLARYWGFGGNQFAAGFNPTQLGFSDSLVKQFTTLQFPRFELGEYTAIGASTVTSKDFHDAYSFQPGFNWIKGRQVIKFGTEVRRYNRNTIGPGVADGLYQFDKRWSQADPLRGDAVSGDEWATFMMGYPVGGRVDSNIDAAYRWHYLALYLQDDYKITPKITLNLGIRWDYEQPIAERFNRMVRSFDRNVDSPINSSLPANFKLKGGILYAGTGGTDRGAFNPDKNNIQPRLGLAWNIRPGWVLRAGYGLSYLGQQSQGAALGYSRPTPLVASNDGLTPIASLSDPFPASIYPSGLLKPIGNSQGLSTNLGLAVTGLYNDRPLPYSQQFSLGFQKELIAGWVSDISYVGNITRKLPVGLGLNFIPLSELLKLPVEQRPAYFTEQLTNPMAGLIPNSSLGNARVTRAQLLYAYPQYTGVTMSDVPIGSQYYHSLQTRFVRRFANCFSTNIAYTWSKTIEQVSVLNAQDVDLGNLLNTKLEKRLNVYDIPHKLAIQAMFELPFGRGKRFGSDMNRVVNGFVGGWNINLQWMVQSGFILQDYPTAAPLSSKSPKLNDKQRLELAKAKGHAYWDVSQDLWYDTSIFPRQARAPYTLQTYPTRFSDVRAWGLNSWEASVYKDIKLTERITFEIRADFQNALNHPWFGQAVSNAVTNARFGLLNADQNNEPRDILLVAKILF